MKYFANHGNTVSTTIPLALEHTKQTEKLQSGELMSLVGFGVGYSWGALVIEVL